MCPHFFSAVWEKWDTFVPNLYATTRLNDAENHILDRGLGRLRISPSRSWRERVGGPRAFSARLLGGRMAGRTGSPIRCNRARRAVIRSPSGDHAPSTAEVAPRRTIFRNRLPTLAGERSANSVTRNVRSPDRVRSMNIKERAIAAWNNPFQFGDAGADIVSDFLCVGSPIAPAARPLIRESGSASTIASRLV